MGDALAVYRQLASEGDYRGYEGALAIATGGKLDPYAGVVVRTIAAVMGDMRTIQSMYPPGFSFGGLVATMDSRYKQEDGTGELLGALRTAPHRHPMLAFAHCARAAGESGRNGDSAASQFLHSLADELGLDENAVTWMVNEYCR